MAPAFGPTTATPLATATTAHATLLAAVAVAAAAASLAMADAVQGMGYLERHPESEGDVERCLESEDDVKRRPESRGKDWPPSTKPALKKPLNPAFQKPLNPRRAARQTAHGAAEVAGCKPTMVTLVW